MALVEIGPKGGRGHNSPLKALPSFEGDTAEGPPRRRAESSVATATFAKQANYFYLYYYYNYFLILSKRNEAFINRKPRIKLEPSELSSH
jgi:hypothetical protein